MPSNEITLQVLKNELGITWQKEATETRLKRYLEEGKEILNHAAGAKLEFFEGTDEGRLLIAYCEYAYYKKTEFFKENYAKDLQYLRWRYQVQRGDSDAENQETTVQ